MHQRNSCESVCPSFGSLRISLTHMCNFSDSFCAPCLIHTTHTCVHSMRVLINVIALYYIFFSWFSFVRIYAKNPKCKLATLIRILCVVLCDGRFGQVCTVCLHLYARTWFDIDNKRRYWYTFGTKIMKKKSIYTLESSALALIHNI